MNKKVFSLALTISLLILYSSFCYGQMDTSKNIDSSLINATIKEVLKETKKGLSREQISLTIIISIAGSIISILIYKIRSIRREKRETE